MTSPALPNLKRDLLAYFEAACQPEPARFSFETQYFIYNQNTRAPAPLTGEAGLLVLLDELQAFGWVPLNDTNLAAGLVRNEAILTLGPGGQLIHRGHHHVTLHQLVAEQVHLLDELGSVTRVLGLGILEYGFHPTARREEMPQVSSPLYAAMRQLMPHKGALGQDFLARTATASLQLTYSSAADMADKLRLGLMLSPLVGALFANSPLRDGHLSGDLSFRNRVWHHTDPDRCTFLEFAFRPDFTFSHYLDYAISVPAYHADGPRQFAELAVALSPAEMSAAWHSHLSTLYPPARLQREIDLRAADMGPPDWMFALAALWVGLLGDATSRRETASQLRGLTLHNWLAAGQEAPRLGLRTRLGAEDRKLGDLAPGLLAVARATLLRRNLHNESGETEASYLAPLENAVSRKVTPADELTRRFCDEWAGSAQPLYG